MSLANTKRRLPDRPTPGAVDPAALARDLEGLAALPLDQLRVQFRNRTGRIAPTRISRPLLLRVLAYRLQADMFGDLRPETLRLLERGAAGRTEATLRREPAALVVAEARMKPRPGTVLVREWQGRMERVTVSDAGYGWNGTGYSSLSAVATAITGTKWNGRRFFGLDRGVRKVGTKGRPKLVGSQATKQAAAVGAMP